MDDRDIRIGQLAVAQNFITAPQLERANDRLESGDDRSLADILVEMGFITAIQADRLTQKADSGEGPMAVRPLSDIVSPAPAGKPPSGGAMAVRPVPNDGGDGRVDGGARAASGAMRVRPIGNDPDRTAVSPADAAAAPPMVKPGGGGPAAAPPMVKPGGDATAPMMVSPISDVGDDEFGSIPEAIPEEAGGASNSADDSAAAIADLISQVSADHSDDAMIGREFAGCEVLERIGEGGMGTIYRVRHLFLNKMLALKLLDTELIDDPQIIQRFLREARSAAQLDHPNIVRVHDVGETDGRFYILMEYVEGQNLTEVMESQGRLSNADSLYVVRQVTQALVSAHAAGIIHRDVKPDNIMIDGARIKVTDFGLAKRLKEGMSLTMPGQIVGSPYFMAPEQADGGMLDERVDIYSLGATWYYMVTGEFPFKGENPMAVILAHTSARLEPPSAHNPTVPPQVEDLILAMMSRDRDRRPVSARALMGELERIRLREKSSFEVIAEDTERSSTSRLAIPTSSSMRGLSAARKKSGTMRDKGGKKKRRPRSSSAIVRKPVSSFMPSIGETVDPEARTEQEIMPVDPSRVVTPGEVQGGVGAGDSAALTPSADPGESRPAIRSRELSPEQKAQADATVQEVRRLMSEGEVIEARERVQRALGRFPLHDGLQAIRTEVEAAARRKEAENLVAEAREKLKLGEGGQVENILERISKLDPGNPAIIKLQDELETLRQRLGPAVEQGLQLIQDGDLDKATKIFEAVLKVDPGHRVATIQLKSIDGRRAEAAEAHLRAKGHADAGRLDQALEAIREGLGVIPDHADLNALKARVEETHSKIGNVLADARTMARSGKWNEAIQAVGKALHIHPDLPEVAQLREQWAEEEKLYRAHVSAGKEAFERADFRAALTSFRDALALNRSCETSQRYADECEPLVEERDSLFQEAERLATEGHVRDALATWQQILDEITPGDEEVIARMEEVETQAKKIDRLEEQAGRAMKKRDFESAIKFYRQLLQIESGDEARAGLEDAQHRLVVKRRRKKLRNLMLVMLLLIGGLTAGVVYLYLEDTKKYETALALMDDARQDLNVASATKKWNEARELLISVRDSLLAPLAGIGLGPADVEDRIVEARLGTTQSEAVSAEAAGRLEVARSAWQQLANEARGEARDLAEDGLARIDLAMIARRHQAALGRLRECIKAFQDITTFAGLGTPEFRRHTVTTAIDEIAECASDLGSIRDEYTRARRPQHDPEFRAPELSPPGSDDTQLMMTLAEESKRFIEFMKVLDGIDPTADEFTMQGLRNLILARPANQQPGAYYSAIRTSLNDAMDSVEGSEWMSRYEPVLAQLRTWERVVPLMEEWHVATARVAEAWHAHIHTQVSAERVMDLFTRAVGSLHSFRRNAQAFSGRPELASITGLDSMVVQMSRWCADEIQQIGTMDTDQPSVLYTLRAVQRVVQSGHRMNFISASADSANGIFVRALPVTWGEFREFVASGYTEIDYWEGYLREYDYTNLRENSKRTVIRSRFPAPQPGAPNEPVTGVSLYECEAWLRWRTANQPADGARFPTAAELESVFRVGAYARVEGSPLSEWSTTLDDTRDANGKPMGVTIGKTGETVARQARDRSARAGVGVRLVHDFPYAPIPPPEFK